MDDNIPEDDFPEGDFPFGKLPPGTFPTPEERDAQALADKLRRTELADYFAATFDSSDPREMPYNDNDHFRQLDELDRHIANPRTTTVREYLGNPWVKPKADIPTDKLEDELDLLLEFMYLYGIAIDFLEEVDDEEAYRFVVDELLDMETDDMSATGMTTHFIYEEFYPNDAYDAKMWAGEFLYSLLRRDTEDAATWIAKDDLSDSLGNPIDRKTMVQMLGQFRSRYSAVTGVELEPVTCKVDGDLAVVEMATTYTGIKATPVSIVKIVGRSTLWLKRDDVDSWSVTRIRIAGWDEVEE